GVRRERGGSGDCRRRRGGGPHQRRPARRRPAPPGVHRMTTTKVDPTARPASRVRRPGRDAAGRVFQGLATGAGVVILAVLAAVAGFLLLQAWPALTGSAEDLGAISWMPDSGSLAAYVGPLVFGTLLAAVLALVIAVPVAIGIALFISHYAPRRLAQSLGYVVDLLAAIPSVVYGLWGGRWLAPRLQGA